MKIAGAMGWSGWEFSRRHGMKYSGEEVLEDSDDETGHERNSRRKELKKKRFDIKFAMLCVEILVVSLILGFVILACVF